MEITLDRFYIWPSDFAYYSVSGPSINILILTYNKPLLQLLSWKSHYINITCGESKNFNPHNSNKWPLKHRLNHNPKTWALPNDCESQYLSSKICAMWINFETYEERGLKEWKSLLVFFTSDYQTLHTIQHLACQ